MSDDDGEENEVFDSAIYSIAFSRDSLREPTNLELAEFIDANNMMWFTCLRCVMLDRDLLHENEEMEAAVGEARAAQKAVFTWWSSLIEDEDGDTITFMEP